MFVMGRDNKELLGFRGRGKSLLAGIFLSFFASVLTACSGMSGGSVSGRAPYVYSGVTSVTPNADGTYIVEWEKLSKPGAVYELYRKDGTDADPTAASQIFDFSRQPFLRTGDTAYTIENVLQKHNACFLVRLVFENYKDTNTKEICTNHTRLRFPGCVSAAASGSSSVQLTVAYPTGASAMRIYRNETLVGTLNAPTTTFSDAGLNEDTTYSYRCEAVVGEAFLAGTQQLTATTANVNAPVFDGLKTVAESAARQVKLTWSAVGAGAPAKEFRVYMKPGLAAPAITPENLVSTLSVSTTETTVSNLGDELQYTFVVLACTSSNLCSGASTPKTSAKLSNQGAPTSLGATAAAMVNGEVQLTVPWSHSHGAVASRLIYMRSGPTGGTNVLNYTLLREDAVSEANSYSPPTTLSVAGLPENTTYHFIVRDKDASGNVSSNTNVATVATGDLTPPIFAGITSLNWGSAGQEDTTLVAQFTAVAPESTNAAGPSYYLIYRTSNGTDPCATGLSPVDTLMAASYRADQNVSYTLTGLAPRTTYKVCVKARDAASNISATSASLIKTTKDITAPTFGGIQTISYNTATSTLSLAWNAAYSTPDDVDSYVVTIWKNNATPTNPVTITKTKTYTKDGLGIASGIALTNADFVMSSNDTIYAYVNACDNAGA